MKLILGASRPLKFKIGAEAIMWWEETPASHVYIMIEVYGLKMVFQAVGSGVQLITYECFLTKNKAVFEKEITINSPDGFQKIIVYMLSRLGAKYSVKHLVGLFYKRLVQYWFKKIIKNPFKDDTKSEVCVECLTKIVDISMIERTAVDPEDMGVYEALEMIHFIPGKVIIGGELGSI